MAKIPSATSVASPPDCSSPDRRDSATSQTARPHSVTDAALSLAMLTALALVAGAAFLWRKGARQRPALMAILAAVMVTNVIIWSLPTTAGKTLATAATSSESPR